MNKIKLNFYEEIITTACPSNFETLKNIISRKFSLEKTDVDELIIFYNNENDKINISNEEDYKEALKLIQTDKNNILTLFLEVSEKSKLYIKQSQPEIKEEKVEKEESVPIIEKVEEQKPVEKEQINLEELIKLSLNEQIEKIKEDLIKKTVAEVNKKSNPVENKVIVHNRYTCDGCGKGPIVGVRYNCTICRNFDLCQECEDKNTHPEDHPLTKYKTEVKFCPLFKFPCWNDFKGCYRPFKNKFRFHHQIKAIKNKYDIKDISEEKLIEALQKANGDIDQAFTYLF